MRQPELGLPFSLDEYASRLAKVRARLAEADLAALLVYWPENIYYLTGFDSLGYFSYYLLVVPLAGEPFLVCRRLERQTVLAATWLEEPELFADCDDPGMATVRALQRRGLAGRRIGVELDAFFLTTRTYLALAQALDLADGSQIVNRIRLVKSARELSYMRAAAEALEAGARAAVEAMRVDATENDVAAAYLHAAVRAGSEYPGHAPLIAAGPRSALAFATWSGRRIAAGDVLTFEPGACVRRYHALMMRTVSVGEPQDRLLRRLSEASIAGLTECMAFIKPGVTAHEVDAAAKAAPRRLGFGACLVSRAGYGVGIGYPPDWGEGRTVGLREGDETVLEANMTFHCLSNLWYSGAMKASFSDTIRVTDAGCEVLSRFPRELIVV